MPVTKTAVDAPAAVFVLHREQVGDLWDDRWVAGGQEGGGG